MLLQSAVAGAWVFEFHKEDGFALWGYYGDVGAAYFANDMLTDDATKITLFDNIFKDGNEDALEFAFNFFHFVVE